MAESIWAKIGGAVKKGGGVVGNVLLLAPKAFIYPIRKPFASWDKMKHDAKVSLKKAVGIGIPEEEKEYDPPIQTTQASENLGVKITEQGKGKVTFLASRTLTGDIPYLTPEQLGEIEKLNGENKYSSIAIFKEENKIVIEVDVENIIKKVKKDNPNMDEKAIKNHVIKAIYGEVDRSLKDLAKITGGEFKIHTDRKLLHGIAEKLYREYDNQSKSTETVVPGEKSPESNEFITQNNMTDPLGMYHVKAGKTTSKGMELEDKLREAIGNEPSDLRFEGNVNSKTKEPSSTPALNGQERRGKGS
ncbi:MAG: hypothetical protein ACR5K9_01760 [Wolbachia sp.]